MSTAEGLRSDNFQTVMRSLQRRLQDSAWTIVYKSLLVVHILIREGEGDIALQYLARHPDMLDVSIGKGGKYIDNGGSIMVIKCYAAYLQCRAREYAKSGEHDFVKETKKPFGAWDVGEKNSILRDLSVEKGLLREAESVQRQIQSLLKCRFNEAEVNNDVIILAFRMLTADLISLYQTLNEAVLNILEHFFELSKFDAQRAYDIYILFTKLTDHVVSFLRTAKHLEKLTKCKVPTIKHAQTSLGSSLKEYIDDPDFDITRRQYLAEKTYLKKAKSGESDDSQNVQKTKPKQQQQQQPAVDQQPQAQQQPQVQQPQVQQPQVQQPQVQQPQVQPDFNAFFGVMPATTGPIPMMVPQFTMQDNIPQQPQQQQQQQFNGLQFTNQPSFQPQQIPSPMQLQQQYTQQQIPIPQPLQQQHTLHYTAPQGISTLPQIGENSTLQPQDTVQYSPVRASTHNGVTNNPFQTAQSQPQQQPQMRTSLSRQNSGSSNNPFAPTSGVSSFNQPSQVQIKPQRLSKAKTGTNPFRLETNVTSEEEKVKPGIIKHYTAGGLENLPTVSVFPETKSSNPFHVPLQYTGPLMQQQAPPAQQQQFTGPTAQFQQQNFTGQVPFQQQNFTGQVAPLQQQNFSGNNFPMQPPMQPPMQQHNSFTGFQPQQMAPQMQMGQQVSGSFYNGPNLLN